MKDVIMVSIDPSSNKTGISMFKNGKLRAYKLLDHSGDKNKTTRLYSMCQDIKNTLNEWNPSIVYIEDSWNAANIEVTKLLSKIIGVVYSWCQDNNCEFNEVLPSVWRKWAGIIQSKKKRAELKQASIDYVLQYYDIDVNDDVADSICIGVSAINYFDALKREFGM